MSLVRRALPFFLPAAAVAILSAGLVYAAAQQMERAGANDPQIQMAEDAATRLDAGATPADVAPVGPSGKVDLATSLAPFLVVYDSSGAVLATNGRLGGADPVIPAGVRDAARRSGRDTVTWQPQAGVRVATVTVPWNAGTVMAGRSLREVEAREDMALVICAAAAVVMLAVVAAASLLSARLLPTGGP